MANHGNKIRKSGNHPPCFTETKSRKILKILIWERHRPWFTETKSRQKYWVPGHNFFLWNFGNVTERVLRKQNPDHHFWKWNLLKRILLIMITNFFSTGRWLVDSKIAFLQPYLSRARKSTNENISYDEGGDKGLVRYTNKRICEYNEKVCIRRRINPITTEELK